MLSKTSSTIAFAALVLPLLAITSNAATYIGCTNASPQVDGDPFPTNEGNAGKCTSICQDSGRDFAYYFESDGTCYCSSVSPDPSQFTAAQAGTGSTCEDTDYTAYDVATPFEFAGCYSNMVTDNNPGDQDTLEDCLAACASEGTAMYLPSTDNDNFACRCNAANVVEGGSGNEVDCAAVTWFNLVHSAAAQASGLTKRALRSRLLAARRAAETLCPSGLTACNVANYNAYECIDTNSELESCGGCLYGEYGATNATSRSGADCSALKGISRGAVTCAFGQCEAFACAEGYALETRQCVSTA